MKMRSTIDELKRLKEILAITAKYGYSYYIRQLKLGHILPLEKKVKYLIHSRYQPIVEKTESQPVLLRKLLTELGPTFIKFGQILSTRADLLPEEYLDELKKLTDSVSPFSFEEAKTIVETELKQPLNKLFQDFQTKPQASASLSQVHKARLFDGREVAVKIQRQNIEPKIKQDLNILLFLAKTINNQLPETRVYRLPEIAKEFAETTLRELDFSIEAGNARVFKRMFENDPTIKIAETYPEYSTSKILTMEFIYGIKIDDLENLKKHKIDSKLLVKNGINAFFKEIMSAGFFHADPHLGNYFALPKSVFCFIDYGMVGFVDKNTRQHLIGIFSGFLNFDSEELISHVRALVHTDTYSDPQAFERSVQTVVQQWQGVELKNASIAQSLLTIMKSGASNGVFFPSSLALLAKCLYALEEMGRKLDSEFNVVEEMRPFLQKMLSERLNPIELIKKSEENFILTSDYAEKFPSLVAGALDKINNGEVQIKLDTKELEDYIFHLNRNDNRRIIITTVAAEIIIFLIVYTIFGPSLHGRLWLLVCGFILLPIFLAIAEYKG